MISWNYSYCISRTNLLTSLNFPPTLPWPDLHLHHPEWHIQVAVQKYCSGDPVTWLDTHHDNSLTYFFLYEERKLMYFIRSLKNPYHTWLIYFFLCFFCGQPVYFLEIAIGQFSSSNSVAVWDMVPASKGLLSLPTPFPLFPLPLFPVLEFSFLQFFHRYEKLSAFISRLV